MLQGAPGVDKLDHHLGFPLTEAPWLVTEFEVQVDACVWDV
jgi:hypothetical protein